METNTKEIWKPLKIENLTSNKQYAISQSGKIISSEKNSKDYLVLKQYALEGYKSITLRVNEKSTSFFLHRLLANTFIAKPSKKHTIVIHLDYNKTNNALTNLKWATPKEAAVHIKNSPAVLAATKHKIPTGTMAKKLNDKKVVALKKEIWNPKRKLSLAKIAENYGIAAMNLHRIKAGLLWSHIHVDGEPEWPKYKEYLKNVEFHKKKTAKALAETEKKNVQREQRLKLIAENKRKKELAKKQRIIDAAKRKTEKALVKEKIKNKVSKKTDNKKKDKKVKETKNFTLVKVLKKRKRK